MQFRIGTTETYDPSLCIDSWKNTIGEYDFILYITKVLNPEVISVLTSDEFMKKMSIIHLTCTGWGGSFLEPNVVAPEVFCDKAKQLIAAGYPAERIVWRVDPIVPIVEGLERFKKSVELGLAVGVRSFRSSMLQLYKHSYARLLETPIIDEINQIYKGKFWPDKEATFDFYMKLRDVVRDFQSRYDNKLDFCACASSQLHQCGFKDFACVSVCDFILNGVDAHELWGHQKGTQRAGCGCLLKHQMIPGGYSRGRCPNKCLYCYLKDKETEEVESETLF